MNEIIHVLMDTIVERIQCRIAAKLDRHIAPMYVCAVLYPYRIGIMTTNCVNIHHKYGDIFIDDLNSTKTNSYIPSLAIPSLVIRNINEPGATELMINIFLDMIYGRNKCKTQNCVL